MSENEETRWLTPAEDETWRLFVNTIIKFPSQLDTQLQADSDLTFYEYMVLAMLSEQQNRTLGMSYLAMLTSGSLSRLSHVIKRLENKGLVTRIPSTEDRRQIYARLTEAGYEQVVQAAPAHANHVKNLIFDRLTSEENLALQKILRTISQEPEES